MNIQQFIHTLKENNSQINVKINEPMKNHTSFKIGGNADVFITVNNTEELKNVITLANENCISLKLFGNGTNILVKDNGIRGIVLKLNMQNIEINKKEEEKEYIVKVQAGIPLGKLAQMLLKNKIGGFEFASGIPGTIGGAIKMNAGAYGGEFKDIVEEVECLDEKNNIIILTNSECQFSYRHSIFSDNKLVIISCKLKLYEDTEENIKRKMNENFQNRKEKQPIEYPSAGSTFKRGENYITAKLIDECGLKGYTIGGAQVSEKHAGFIINKGNATAKDIIDLIEYVKKVVYEKTGNDIKLEIEIIGE